MFLFHSFYTICLWWMLVLLHKCLVATFLIFFTDAISTINSQKIPELSSNISVDIFPTKHRTTSCGVGQNTALSSFCVTAKINPHVPLFEICSGTAIMLTQNWLPSLQLSVLGAMSRLRHLILRSFYTVRRHVYLGRPLFL